EGKVAGAEDLVDQQNLRLNGSSDGERQTHEHAGGGVADGDIEEAAEVAEVGDLLHLGANGARRLTLQVAAVKNVLPAACFHFEAQIQLKERANLPLHDASPTCRGINAGEQPQQRALAGT